VLAAKHLLDLAGLHVLVERIEPGGEFAVDRLTGLRPFDEDGQIIGLFLERRDQFAILLESAPALLHFLRVGGILPEVGRGGARVEDGQLLVGAGRLKDSSGDLEPAA